MPSSPATVLATLIGLALCAGAGWAVWRHADLEERGQGTRGSRLVAGGLVVLSVVLSGVSGLAGSFFALLSFLGEQPGAQEYADSARSLLTSATLVPVLTIVAVLTLRLSTSLSISLVVLAGAVATGLALLGTRSWERTGRPWVEVWHLDDDRGALFAALSPTSWLLLAVALAGLLRVVVGTTARSSRERR